MSRRNMGAPGPSPWTTGGRTLPEAAAGAFGAGLQGGGVGAGAGGGFGHREAGAHAAGDQGSEVLLLLLGGGDLGEHVDVALVGGGAVEGQRPQQAGARLLQQDRGLVQPETAAAPLRGRLGCEDPPSAGLLLQ